MDKLYYLQLKKQFLNNSIHRYNKIKTIGGTNDGIDIVSNDNISKKIKSEFKSIFENDIHLKNKDISNYQPYKIARMGMVRTFQLTKVFDRMTVLENLLFSGSEISNDSLFKSVIKSKSQKKYFGEKNVFSTF